MKERLQGSSLLLPSGEEAKVKYDGSRRALHHYPSASEWSSSPAAELAVSPQRQEQMQEKAGRTQRGRKSYPRAEELNSRLLNREIKTNRAKLTAVCREHGIEWLPMHLEEAHTLKDESFDIITCTHCAYYYYNQPLAHRELFRLLKPNGRLIVTLVSQFCVLNRLTEQLLGPHLQFALNAETYLTMMSKLSLFSLERVESFSRAFDGDYYTYSDEKLMALEYTLARHRIRQADIDSEMDRFGTIVHKHHGLDRVNLIMFFGKAARGTIPELRSGLDEDISTLRLMSAELAEHLPPEKKEVLAGDLDAFVSEAVKNQNRRSYLEAAGLRLVEAAVDARWESNRLRQRVDTIVAKTIKASPRLD